jgi:hypothetical protein
MDNYTVEFTVWIDLSAESGTIALKKATEMLSWGEWDNASLNIVTDGEGNEVTV